MVVEAVFKWITTSQRINQKPKKRAKSSKKKYNLSPISQIKNKSKSKGKI